MSQRPPPPQRQPGDWTCPGCGANVFKSKAECFKCKAPRPERPADGDGGASRAPPPKRRGDWTCPQCAANVFASNSECFRCQTPRPVGGGGGTAFPPPNEAGEAGCGDGGGGGGEGGGGPPQRRRGDWQCPNCQANVFASRSECYRCHAPKPDESGAELGESQPAEERSVLKARWLLEEAARLEEQARREEGGWEDEADDAPGRAFVPQEAAYRWHKRDDASTRLEPAAKRRMMVEAAGERTAAGGLVAPRINEAHRREWGAASKGWRVWGRVALHGSAAGVRGGGEEGRNARV